MTVSVESGARFGRERRPSPQPLQIYVELFISKPRSISLFVSRLPKLLGDAACRTENAEAPAALSRYFLISGSRPRLQK